MFFWAAWFVKLACVAALFSCSPAWHIQKACNKQPELCELDTVIQDITIINESPKLDTVFIPKRDTTYIIQSRDSVIVRFKVSHDTVKIEAECPPEKEIIKVIEKPVPVLEPKKWHQRVPWWAWALSGIGIGFIGLIIVVLKK